MPSQHDRTTYHSGVEPATAVVIDPAIGTYPKDTTVQDVLEGIHASIEEFGSGNRVFGKKKLNAVIQKSTTKRLYLSAYVSYGTSYHTLRMRARITNATTMPGSFSGDAYVPANVGATVSADAVIKAPVPFTFLAESGPYLVAGGLKSGSFTANARFAYIRTLTSDAIFFRNTEKRQRLRFYAFARIVRRVIGVGQQLTADAIVMYTHADEIYNERVLIDMDFEDGAPQVGTLQNLAGYTYHLDYSADVPADGELRSLQYGCHIDPGVGQVWYATAYAMNTFAYPDRPLSSGTTRTLRADFDYRIASVGSVADAVDYWVTGYIPFFGDILDTNARTRLTSTEWEHVAWSSILPHLPYPYTGTTEIYFRLSVPQTTEYIHASWSSRLVLIDNLRIVSVFGIPELIPCNVTADAIITLHHEAAEMLPNNGFEYDIIPWTPAHPEREGWAELVDWDGSQHDTGRGAMYVETYDVSTDEGARGSFLARILKGETYRFVSFVKSLGLPFMFRQKLGRFIPTSDYEKQTFTTGDYTVTTAVQWAIDPTSSCWVMWPAIYSDYFGISAAVTSSTIGTPYGPGDALRLTFPSTSYPGFGVAWNIPGEFLDDRTYRVRFWLGGYPWYTGYNPPTHYDGPLHFKVTNAAGEWAIIRPAHWYSVPAIMWPYGTSYEWVSIEMEFRPPSGTTDVLVGFGKVPNGPDYTRGQLWTYAPEVYEVTNLDTYTDTATVASPSSTVWSPVPLATVSTYGQVGSVVRLRYDAELTTQITNRGTIPIIWYVRFVRNDGKIIDSLTSNSWSGSGVMYGWALDTLEVAGHYSYTVEVKTYSGYSTYDFTTNKRSLTVDSDDMSAYSSQPDPDFVADSSLMEHIIDDSDWHRVETLWTADEDYPRVDIGLLSVDVEEDVFLVDRVSLDIARLTIPAQADILVGTRMWGDFLSDSSIAPWFRMDAYLTLVVVLVFEDDFNRTVPDGIGGRWHIDPFDTVRGADQMPTVSVDGSALVVAAPEGNYTYVSFVGSLPYVTVGSRIQFDFWIPAGSTDTEYVMYVYPFGIDQRSVMVMVYQPFYDDDPAEWALDLGGWDPLYTKTFEPDTWGTAAFLVIDATIPVLGKLWKRGEAEPEEWSDISLGYSTSSYLGNLPAPLLDFYWIEAGMTAKVDNIQVWMSGTVTYGNTLQSDAVISSTREGIFSTPTIVYSDYGTQIGSLTYVYPGMSFPGAVDGDLVVFIVAGDYCPSVTHAYPNWTRQSRIQTVLNDASLDVWTVPYEELGITNAPFRIDGNYQKSWAFIVLHTVGANDWAADIAGTVNSDTYSSNPTISDAATLWSGLSLISFAGSNSATAWSAPTGWDEVVAVVPDWAQLHVSSKEYAKSEGLSVTGVPTKVTAQLGVWVNFYKKPYAFVADAVIE
jgi:hypothetical protein